MDNFFENVKDTMKKIVKTIGKTITKAVLPIVLIIFIAVVIVSGLIYELTKQDASYKEGDMSNTPFAVTKYTSDVTIDKDGNITTSMTAKELWEEMIKNHGRVDEYLDGPEDLLKLMNAEIVTNFPDTRKNPDEEIDWDSLNKDIESNKAQGIIKFKRAKSDGSISTMTYVDPETFYKWVESYNQTQDKPIKQKIINCITIEEINSNSNNNNNNGEKLEYDSKDIVTDISNAIVEAAKRTPSTGDGMCQYWVRKVYVNAGLPDVGYNTAYLAFKANCKSTDMNNIPIGAAVYGTGNPVNGSSRTCWNLCW